MFRRGKTSVLKLFKKNKDLIDCAKEFEEIEHFPQTIITKGIRFLLADYEPPKKLIVSTSIDILLLSKILGTSNKYHYLVLLQHRFLLINTYIEYTIKFRHG